MQKPKATSYLHQNIVPRLGSDLEPRVSGILHLCIREDHLKVSIIPATQVSRRAFTELQKEKRRVYASVTVVSSKWVKTAFSVSDPLGFLPQSIPQRRNPKGSMSTAASPTKPGQGMQQNSIKFC
jgi:hypothetical protein